MHTFLVLSPLNLKRFKHHAEAIVNGGYALSHEIKNHSYEPMQRYQFFGPDFAFIDLQGDVHINGVDRLIRIGNLFEMACLGESVTRLAWDKTDNHHTVGIHISSRLSGDDLKLLITDPDLLTRVQPVAAIHRGATADDKLLTKFSHTMRASREEILRILVNVCSENTRYRSDNEDNYYHMGIAQMIDRMEIP